MTIGKRIKYRRKALGLLQSELASAVGVNHSLISYLESDKQDGTAHVATIARALKVNAVWLQTGEGDPFDSELLTREVTKTYFKEIEEVIKLMESTDERGRLKILIAAKDALDAHRAWKNSLPRSQEVNEMQEANEINELASQLEKRLLSESLENIESETPPNDVYHADQAANQKDKHY